MVLSYIPHCVVFFFLAAALGGLEQSVVVEYCIPASVGAQQNPAVNILLLQGIYILLFYYYPS